MSKKILFLSMMVLSFGLAATVYGAVVEGRDGGPGVSNIAEDSSGALSDGLPVDGGTEMTDKIDETSEAKQETISGPEAEPAEETKAAETGVKAEGPETELGTRIESLDVPSDAEVLVVVEGSGLDAVVSAYRRDRIEGEADTADASADYTGWELFASTKEGKLGRKGLGKAVEGDEKTPVGIFKMNTPFGIADALEGFPENYIKVTSDLYWNGDSDSPLYNRLVSTNNYNDFNKSKSEHLINYGGYYDYCIDMGYNPEGTPHLGSALFLHCSMGQNTGGCIAIPKDVMTVIMQNYREGKTYIAVGYADRMNELYKI